MGSEERTMEEELSHPILLADRVCKSVTEADSFKQECSDVDRQVDRLAQMLRSIVRLATSSSSNSTSLYERPVLRIVSEVTKNLERALTLIRKCKRSRVLRRVATITSATDFRKLAGVLDASIADMKWLLIVLECDGSNFFLSMPPISSNDPILSWVWSFIAVIQMSSFLPDRVEAANELASFARISDRSKKIIVQEDGIPPLLRLLKEGASGDAQVAAATALANLATDEEGVRLIVAKLGVPTIVQVLWDSPMAVQIAVTNLVCRMTENDVEAQEEFARLNAIRPLVSLLSTEMEVLDHPRPICVKTREECEFPIDMQCKDQFLIQSVITNARITDKDVTSAMNSKTDEESREQSSENASLRRRSARLESIENLIRQLATDKPRQFSHEHVMGFTSNLSTKLGSGAFGNVYKGQLLNGVEIAVKVLVENEVVEEEFMAEVSTMGRTYHRNLVKLYGFCFDDNMKALVYEYAKNGSLDHVLYENRFDLKWEKLYDIAVEIAKALLYLHDGCYEKIIHYDIKPANVLLDSYFSPKITDFGLAKLMSRDVTHFIMTSVRGTPGFAAPETFMHASEITYKCDVYSFGMMLFEILGRKRNATRKAWFAKQVWQKFEKGQLDEIIQECGITEENKEKAKVLSYIALWCIQHTAETRPSMSTVSTMLEKEIQVTAPPNPFLSALSIYSMQPAPHSQQSIHSDVSSS